MDPKPTPIILDANSGQVVRLLHPDACFFIERTTGNVDVVAKDRVSNAFRRDGDGFKYYSHGADKPPLDPGSYATIEDLESLVENVSDDAREGARLARQEPPPVQTSTPKHITDLDPPPADPESKDQIE